MHNVFPHNTHARFTPALAWLAARLLVPFWKWLFIDEYICFLADDLRQIGVTILSPTDAINILVFDELAPLQRWTPLVVSLWCRVRRLSLPGPPTASLRRETVGVLAGTHQRATDAQAGWHRKQSANPRAVSASPLVQTNCDSHVLWHVGILTPLFDDERCLASSQSFPTVPLLTWLVGSRRQLSFELKLFIRPAVCSRSLPLPWSWLQSSALVVVKLWILSQQPPSRFVSTADSLPYDLRLLYILLLLCCSSSDFLTICTLSFSSAAFCSSVASLAICCTCVTSHRLSLHGRGFHSLRIRRRQHLVHHGLVLVLVAVLSISSVLLSVRVSDFVPFCILGFLDCGRVSLDLLHLTHIVGIVVLLLVLLVLVGEYSFITFWTSLCSSTALCAATSVFVSLSRLTSDELGLLRLVLVSVLCCLLDLAMDLSIILDWGKLLSRSWCHARPGAVWCRAPPPCARYLAGTVSSFGFVTFFLSCWIPLKPLWELCHSDWPCQIRTRGDLWVGSLAILACCKSTPTATAVLNSWTQCRVWKSHCSRPSSWHFLILTLPFRNCGCPFLASLQLAFRAHALQRNARLVLLFLQRLLNCPNLVLSFCSSSSSAWISVLLLNVSLPCFNTHLISLKVLAASHELRLIAVCFRLRLHIVTPCTSQWYPLTLWASCWISRPIWVTIGHQLFLRNSESLFKHSLWLPGSSSLFSMPPQTLSFQFSLWASPLLWTCAILPVLDVRYCLPLLNVCSPLVSFL